MAQPNRAAPQSMRSTFSGPNMLYGKILGSPIAAGTLKSIDTKAAEALKGVEAVHLLKQPGATINWAGEEILALAATTEEIATEALRLIEAEYDLGTAASRSIPIPPKWKAAPARKTPAIPQKRFPKRRPRSKAAMALPASRTVAWSRTARYPNTAKPG